MTSREEMVQGTTAVNDIGHIVLSAVTVLLILSQIGLGAAAFGKRFRVYSLVTGATVVVFGALTGMQSPKVPEGEPTPWMGLFERVSVWAWLLWMAVLAIILLRTRSTADRSIPRNRALGWRGSSSSGSTRPDVRSSLSG